MVGDKTIEQTPVLNVFHPALNVTNVRNLVPLTLDIDNVQYSPWATLFRNTTRAYNVLDHIDPKIQKPKDIDDELWNRLDAIVLQWLYGTISTDLLYKILDEKATAMVAWDRLRNLFQDNKGVPANIEDAINIILDRKDKGQNLFNKPPPLIYMVPSDLRDLSPSSFKPQVVSIGPLHREDKKLLEFEEQKTTHLHHLLDRLDSCRFSSRQILNECFQRVNDSIDRIRACYAGINHYTDVELANMMVTDASFILEFLFPRQQLPLISGNVVIEHSIFDDLVLLENQIPFFVLQDIFDCTIFKMHNTSTLSSGVLQTLQHLNPFGATGNEATGTTHHHILGLLHKSLHPTNDRPSTMDLSLFKNSKRSSLELHHAGVKFKPNVDENWKMAIEFRSSWFASFFWCWGNHTLTLPVLEIQDRTEMILRNLIAYEQCTPDVPYYITSYAFAIDTLVDTAEDLSKLVESKVLINKLGSNEEATNMINSICTRVVLEEFYYIEQWKQLDTYYNGYWPKNIAWLKRTYFDSPWSVIALFAGFVLFVLTIIQTIFTIKAAY